MTLHCYVSSYTNEERIKTTSKSILPIFAPRFYLFFCSFSLLITSHHSYTRQRDEKVPLLVIKASTYNTHCLMFFLNTIWIQQQQRHTKNDTMRWKCVTKSLPFSMFHVYIWKLEYARYILFSSSFFTPFHTINA